MPRASVGRSPAPALSEPASPHRSATPSSSAAPAGCRTAATPASTTEQRHLAVTDLAVVRRGWGDQTAIVGPQCVIQVVEAHGNNRNGPEHVEALPLDGRKPITLATSHWRDQGWITDPVVLGHWLLYADHGTVEWTSPISTTASVADLLDLDTGAVRTLPHTKVRGKYTYVGLTRDGDRVIVQVTNPRSRLKPSRAWSWSPGLGMRRLPDLPGDAVGASFSAGVGTYEAPAAKSERNNGDDCWSIAVPTASSAASGSPNRVLTARSLTPHGHTAGCTETDGWLVWGEATSRGQIEANEDNDEGYVGSDRVLARPVGGGPTETLHSGTSLAGFGAGDGWVAWTLQDYSTLVVGDPSTGHTIERYMGKTQLTDVLDARGDLLAYRGPQGDLHLARVTLG